MESTFILKATEKEAQALFDDTRATVKLMEFMGDKNEYPEIDMSSPAIHKWRVLLRHAEQLGELKGTRTYARIDKLLNF